VKRESQRGRSERVRAERKGVRNVEKHSAAAVVKPAKLLLKITVLALNRKRLSVSQHAEACAFLSRKRSRKIGVVIVVPSGKLKD